MRDSELRGLPVVTRGGEKLGKLVRIIIDIDRHEVAQYAVARSLLLAKILPDELLIHPSQVVSVDAEKMTVEDAVVTEAAAAAARRPGEAASPSGAASMRS